MDFDKPLWVGLASATAGAVLGAIVTRVGWSAGTAPRTDWSSGSTP